MATTLTTTKARAFWIVWITIIACLVLALVALFILGIREAVREERALRAMPPAERAVERHVMADGTVCYQPRAGWSRPLSCVRP